MDLNRAAELTVEVDAAVEDLFEYHPWDAEQQSRGSDVRHALANAVKALIANVPPCPTRTRAINHIVDARMLANAAITFKGKY